MYSAIELRRMLVAADTYRSDQAWSSALRLYRKVDLALPHSAAIKHNLALCLFGLGQLATARRYCIAALQASSQQWQSGVLLARILKAQGDPEGAESRYRDVLALHPDNGDARIGLADLALNEFGNPLAAVNLVQPLINQQEHGRDAELTCLMASLYDRDFDAETLVGRIKEFSARELTLPVDYRMANQARQGLPEKRRLRVGLLSPHFSASPVYFLTIYLFRRMSAHCDVIVFNRGTRSDWATDAFRGIATRWHDVQYLAALSLAEMIHGEEIDELYDLGGWMDPIGLQALSAKPAIRQYKWVGGQSVTTGLRCFDGWLGDSWQSPSCFQGLYSEPLINLEHDYAKFTPPPYLPKAALSKSSTLAVFANPAKLSRSFLMILAGLPGKKCFIHRQFRHAQVRDRIEAVLGRKSVEYIYPESHQEALMALNRFSTMIDTFPYSSGLTAREAIAMGTKVHVLGVGKLFCERHSARYLG